MVNSIWITGASSGIGKALALKFAKNNWKVAISARREELLKDAKGKSLIMSLSPSYNPTDKKTILNRFKKMFK